MPVIIVSTTDAAARLLRYTDTDKPDQADRGERVLHMAGIGCTPAEAVEQFRQTRVRYGTEGQLYRGKPAAEARHVIVSFALAEADPDDPDDVLRAFEFAVAMTRELWPGVMAKIVLQADGDGADGQRGKLHAHVVLNATVTEEFTVGERTYRPGKKLGGPAMDIDIIRARHDQFMIEHPEFGFSQALASSTDLRPVVRSKADVQIAKRGGQSRRDQLRSMVDEVIADPAVRDLNDLGAAMASRGVVMELRGSDLSYRVPVNGGRARRAVTTQNLRGRSLGTRYQPQGLLERIAERDRPQAAPPSLYHDVLQAIFGGDATSQVSAPPLQQVEKQPGRQELARRARKFDAAVAGKHRWLARLRGRLHTILRGYRLHAPVQDRLENRLTRSLEIAPDAGVELPLAAPATEQATATPSPLVSGRQDDPVADDEALRVAAATPLSVEPEYRSPWRKVTGKDQDKIEAFAVFDEAARRSIRAKQQLVEAQMPKGIGPALLERHPEWWAPEVLNLLQRREQTRAVGQRLYALSEKAAAHEKPLIASWRADLVAAMRRGEYGAGSRAVEAAEAKIAELIEARSLSTRTQVDIDAGKLPDHFELEL